MIVEVFTFSCFDFPPLKIVVTIEVSGPISRTEESGSPPCPRYDSTFLLV